MPNVADVVALRDQAIEVLPEGEAIEYRDYLQRLSEAGLGEAKGHLQGMKSSGLIERWLVATPEGIKHFVARPGVRSALGG